MDWEKRKKYNKIDHYAEAIERNQKEKPLFKAPRELKLGIHQDHNWQIINEPTGPHRGKVICKTCGGKFVTWLPKGAIKKTARKGGGPEF